MWRPISNERFMVAPVAVARLKSQDDIRVERIGRFDGTGGYKVGLVVLDWENVSGPVSVHTG